MDTSRQALENADLEKLNDKDKQELRQFLANESSRSQIQSRMLAPPCSPLLASPMEIHCREPPRASTDSRPVLTLRPCYRDPCPD